jgi:hypothetical protein
MGRQKTDDWVGRSALGRQATRLAVEKTSNVGRHNFINMTKK